MLLSKNDNKKEILRDNFRTIYNHCQSAASNAKATRIMLISNPQTILDYFVRNVPVRLPSSITYSITIHCYYRYFGKLHCDYQLGFIPYVTIDNRLCNIASYLRSRSMGSHDYIIALLNSSANNLNQEPRI